MTDREAGKAGSCRHPGDSLRSGRLTLIDGAPAKIEAPGSAGRRKDEAELELSARSHGLEQGGPPFGPASSNVTYFDDRTGPRTVAPERRGHDTFRAADAK